VVLLLTAIGGVGLTGELVGHRRRCDAACGRRTCTELTSYDARAAQLSIVIRCDRRQVRGASQRKILFILYGLLRRRKKNATWNSDGSDKEPA